MSTRRFLALQGAVFCGLLLACVCVNWTIDPFGIWHEFRWRGLNAYRVESWQHQHLHKVTALARYRPDGVIFGTSRAMGFSPAHPGFSAGVERGYNLAIASSRMADADRYVNLAASLEPPRRIVLVLDFLMFAGAAESNAERHAARVEWFRTHAGGLPDPGDWLATLLSRDALDATRRTLDRQAQAERRSYLRPDGSGTMGKLARAIDRRGQRGVFISTEVFLADTIYRGAAAPHWRIAKGFAHLEAILAPHGDDVDIQIVIPPAHARVNEILFALGLWEHFEAWKRELLALSLRQGGRAVWDFSGYNRVTTEPVPAADDPDARMQWYWDGSHFTDDIATRIMDRMFAVAEPAYPEWPDFGRRLTPDDIEDHLAAIRLEREAYVGRNRSDLEDLAVDLLTRTEPLVPPTGLD